MNNDVYNFLLKNRFVDSKSSNYIWIPEMFFFDPERIDYYNNNRYDYLKTENYFIFAKNAYGDFFAWNKNDESVIICDQGSGYGMVFAPNLAAAIFRRIIEFASGEYVDFCSDEEKEEMDSDEAEEYISEKEALGLMKLYKSGFCSIFKSEWIEVIDNLIDNGFADDDSFIDGLTQMKIVNEYVYCKDLNSEVNLN